LLDRRARSAKCQLAIKSSIKLSWRVRCDSASSARGRPSGGLGRTHATLLGSMNRSETSSPVENSLTCHLSLIQLSPFRNRFAGRRSMSLLCSPSRPATFERCQHHIWPFNEVLPLLGIHSLVDLEIREVTELRCFVVNGKRGNRARSRCMQFLRAPRKLAGQGYEVVPCTGSGQECSRVSLENLRRSAGRGMLMNE
jgi:hypothetical protein